MKPKQNNKIPAMDRCQTPPHAYTPLAPYIAKNWLVWEPAQGEGHLLSAIEKYNRVCGTDILTGDDFFETTNPSWKWDCIVTNPPFSIKYKWIQRCYDFGKPFALLLPLETLGAATAQMNFERYGVEIIVLNRRVNFKMPNKGWDSSAQFPVAWFTHGLNLGGQITYGKLPIPAPAPDGGA